MSTGSICITGSSQRAGVVIFGSTSMKLARRTLKGGTVTSCGQILHLPHVHPRTEVTPTSQRGRATYLEALGTLPNLTIHLGAFLEEVEDVQCMWARN